MPGNLHVHTSVCPSHPRKRKNTLCICLTFWSHKTQFSQNAGRSAQNKTGSNTGERDRPLYFPRAPESSSSGSSSLASSPPPIPSAPTVTKPEQQGISKTLIKKQIVTKHQRRGGGGQSETDRERKSESVCGCAGGARRNQKPVLPGLFQFVFAFKSYTSDLVIDVGRALRRHLLNYVDRMAVVAADLLVVWAEDAVSSPERDDDVARL